MSRPAHTGTRVSSHSTAVVCQDADLRGDITIGEGTIVHPTASILALQGPIVIGKHCMIEETAIILNRRKETMVIGDHNVFMVGCRVESPSIGDHNSFHPRSKASNRVHISDHCNLGAGTALLPLDTESDKIETLPPYTVIYGAENARRTWDASGEQTEANLKEKHIEYLREIIPKYNRQRDAKPSTTTTT